MSTWFASYTELRAGEVARTICVGDSVMIDLDAEDRPVGVETLDPVADWRGALATLAMAGQMKLAHGTTP